MQDDEEADLYRKAVELKKLKLQRRLKGDVSTQAAVEFEAIKKIAESAEVKRKTAKEAEAACKHTEGGKGQ